MANVRIQKGRQVAPLHTELNNNQKPVGDACAEVADWVAAAVRQAEGVEAVRVRIREVPGEELAVGQVNLDRDRCRLRVQAAATRPRHAGMLLIERTARQLHHTVQGFHPRPWPDPMAGLQPGARGGPGGITRRKQVRLEILTAQQALTQLDVRDQQAHLFTDADTGTDALVYRGGPHGYRLARTVGAAPAAVLGTVLVTSPRPTPRLTEDEALTRIGIGTDPFVFYREPRGRGALLYARYHGGFGLITAR